MRRVLIAVALTLVASAAQAQGWIIPRCGPVIRPTVPIRDCATNIVRTRSDVHVELADRVLRYEVEERFVNRGGGVGEADYLFPLPNDAAFQDLKLSINGQLVSGETMNSTEARRIYENIVRTQRDPALVEWMGRGLVRARVFPINPGEEKRVIIRFQSVAPREGDALRVDYLRAARQTEANEGASAFDFSYRATPELGTPYSPTHQLDIADRDGKRRVTVRGDARDVTLLLPVRKPSAASIAMLPYAPGGEDGFALITVTPPATRVAESTPRDVTLVLDVSGSMSGRKIEQARAAGRQLLGTLRPEDRFRIIDFSNEAHTFRDDFIAASSDNVRDAERYLAALEAVGGTNIEGALKEVARGGTTRGRLPLVLFITDGEPTVGERAPERLAELARGPRIFTFGLGSDVNVSLLEQLALDGRGTSQFVRPDESVERMVGVVASRLVDPVLTDVRVRAEGGVKLMQLSPSQSADVFAERDLVILARYSGHGPARIVVEGNRRGSAARWETNVDFPERERENPFVARLWATQRVGFLSAEKRKNGGSRELDDEIRSLGERYGIPTEFTSYLVVEPQVAAMRAASGRPAFAPAAPSARDASFEAARAASEQRLVLNTAALDSTSAVKTSSTTRRVGGRTFELRSGVWTDARYVKTMETTTIKPYSKAYFDLIAAIPELKSVFVLGERVVAVGRGKAIALGESGLSELSAPAVASLIKSW
jgi:Ca-activated chloride channel family protein